MSVIVCARRKLYGCATKKFILNFPESSENETDHAPKFISRLSPIQRIFNFVIYITSARRVRLISFVLNGIRDPIERSSIPFLSTSYFFEVLVVVSEKKRLNKIG